MSKMKFFFFFPSLPPPGRSYFVDVCGLAVCSACFHLLAHLSARQKSSLLVGGKNLHLETEVEEEEKKKNYNKIRLLFRLGCP